MTSLRVGCSEFVLVDSKLLKQLVKMDIVNIYFGAGRLRITVSVLLIPQKSNLGQNAQIYSRPTSQYDESIKPLENEFT